ncbi:MAG: serine kinase [Candidatus Eremiobacteraeota bacterium]|nr:serine kinase [Candidatus Eremiobacteraeota bacterium]
MGLEVKTARSELEREVTGGYASDLLSDVMANARKDDLWVTLQTHQNIVAVATLKGVAGVILVNDRVPEEDTVQLAEEEHLPLLVTGLPAFEIIGRLYEMGIKGSR